MSQKMKDGRTIKSRYWAFILYPESAPKRWIMMLKETTLKIAISPIHDMDIEEETGELKKAHYHVLLCFGNTTTSSAADTISSDLNGTKCIPITSAWGYYRYLDHDLESDKAKYKHDDILLLGSLTEWDIKTFSKEDERKMRIQIHQLIHDNKICEYDDLLMYLLSVDNDLYDYAWAHTIAISAIITSYRNKNAKKETIN